ncbi:hypothetical protein VE23_25400 [Paenibacillus sp. D9]|uniref:hypothetical protein n=1 Tax=Paenibacillus sp. D9 TaxID=665792 RepID=UPI00061E7130|nr:hypothetical protein [Paenibacillus sp. D9]KKC45853.1 hypothetical protein VE23_25400 [Paenibacillus sp. D9]
MDGTSSFNPWNITKIIASIASVFFFLLSFNLFFGENIPDSHKSIAIIFSVVLIVLSLTVIWFFFKEEFKKAAVWFWILLLIFISMNWYWNSTEYDRALTNYMQAEDALNYIEEHPTSENKTRVQLDYKIADANLDLAVLKKKNEDNPILEIALIGISIIMLSWMAFDSRKRTSIFDV